MVIKNVLIMAAGKGERMMPLTTYIPKAMILYKNKTLIERSIDNLRKYNLNIHVTVGHKSDILSAHLIKLGIDTIINTDKKENAWWIFNSLLKNLNEPVLVLTCDNIMDFDLYEIMKNYIDCPCLLIPTIVKNNIDGDYIHKIDQKVIKLSRTKKSDIYGSGCQIINPFIINNICNEEDFNDLWNDLIKKEKLMCSEYIIQSWNSIDTIEQLNNLLL